jgi:hypothetical protein
MRCEPVKPLHDLHLLQKKAVRKALPFLHDEYLQFLPFSYMFFSITHYRQSWMCLLTL